MAVRAGGAVLNTKGVLLLADDHRRGPSVWRGESGVAVLYQPLTCLTDACLIVRGADARHVSIQDPIARRIR
jgi:hypothetical protein